MKIKKVFKITLAVFFTALLSLLAAPVLFKGKIETYIKNQINENLYADVNFEEIDLSFIKSFPNASISIKELNVTNREPFLGDTLLRVKNINAKMSLSELTKLGKDKVGIDAFKVNGVRLNLISNVDGVTNYHITKDNKKTNQRNSEEKKEKSDLQLRVSEYGILNAEIDYLDEATGTHLQVLDLNHIGTGDLANDIVDLDTETSLKLSLDQNETNILTNYNVKLDAIINIDSKKEQYTFKENKLLINQLEMIFDGFLKSNEDNQEIDVNFKTPSTSFRNFIALIPSAYGEDLENVYTEGNFEVSGFAKGIIDDNTIPKFVVDVVSQNASVQYPELPKSIEEINLKAQLANTSGNSEDTFLDINKLSFSIDQDVFNASSVIKNLSANPLVDAHLDGVLNLANLSKAYPINMENQLEGIFKVNLNTHFDMESVEQEDYQNIRNEGDFSIQDFVYSSKDVVNPIHISKAAVNFKNQEIALDEFIANTGKSDLYANGTIQNLLGFLFDGKELKGNFNVTSDLFAVNDFMVDNTDKADASSSTKTTETGDALKIPAFLDATIKADAKTVLYDNLTLNNVKGDLIIRDETAMLRNMSTDIFDGNLAINGSVSTKEETPTFVMDLGVEKFDISKSFKALDLFQGLTPIAKALNGKLNTSLKLEGKLNDQFAPELNTLTGTALTEIITATITPRQAETLQMLENQLSFLDWKKLDLKDLKTKLSFNNGKVNVDPFNVKYDDIDIQIAGAHGFDKSVDYEATFDVPAKYFGEEVNSILSKLNDDKVENMKVPVVANITGTSRKPVVKTDMATSIKKLTAQLVEYQQKKLLGQGTGFLDDLINGNKDTDSTSVGGGLGDVIGDVLGSGNNNQDSTKTDDPNVIDDVLDIFGKKKKDKNDDD